MIDNARQDVQMCAKVCSKTYESVQHTVGMIY
jgi:hypothetical protein